MRKVPLIFDCDPGHDDAIALLIALANEKVDLKAITTVYGNSSIENTTQNALKILELCKRTDIEVAKGASRSFWGKPGAGANVHGESGMDGPALPPPIKQPSTLSAVEMMEKVVKESEYPVTIVATGPLTNVATFLLSNPDLKSKIECISIMGGGIEQGNRTPVAEFNIWIDPEAAQVVMSSGIPLVVYGLNVTHKALILKEEFDMFRRPDNPVSQFVADLLDFFIIYYMGTGKLPGCPMHDSCAIAGIVDPRMFDYEHTQLAVDLDGHYTRGAMYIDVRTEPRRDYPYHGKAAIDIDRKRLLDLILDSCERLHQKASEGGK